MTDPLKQQELAVKLARSQQKLTEWSEELRVLKGRVLYQKETKPVKVLYFLKLPGYLIYRFGSFVFS